MNLNSTSLLQPVAHLFSSAPDTYFSELIKEGIQLAKTNPQLLEMISNDLDKRSLEKKRERLEDQAWCNNQTIPILGMDTSSDEDNILQLSQGRPRMPPLVVLVFLLLRGYLGGIKKKKTLMTLIESQSLKIFLTNSGCKMPRASTVLDNINAVSVKTLEEIHDAQIKLVIMEDLDDFKHLTVDSTSIASNSAWPVDSVLIMKLVCRIVNLIESLSKHGVSPLKIKDIVNTMINEIKELNKTIQFSTGKKNSAKKRKKLYNKLYRLARKVRKHLLEAQEKAIKRVDALNVPPSKTKTLNIILEWIETDLHNLDVVTYHSSKRINEEKQTPSEDKVLSLSDVDAAMISKGQREPVLGYKPQICRSENGIIPAIIVPEGNANDAGQMDAIVDKAIEKTGIIPEVLSFDDGYANTKIRNKYLEKNVKIVSFSGSKGKKIIPESEYESEEYKKARNNRSAVESLMYTIKHNEDFGEVMRRGLDQARSESLEKVLVHNFFRIIELRSRKERSIKKIA